MGANRNRTILLHFLIQMKDNRCNINVENTRQHQCREYTMSRNEKRTRVRGSVRKGARICPDIKICCRDDRHSIEVQVLSLFQDIVASWVWIVNDVYKYVTESLPLKEKEDTTSEKSICQVRPRQNTAVTLTSVSIHVLERKWIEIESQRSHNPKCDEVSKVITDYYDMTNQCLEEATEQSTTVTSSKSAGRSPTKVQELIVIFWIHAILKSFLRSSPFARVDIQSSNDDYEASSNSRTFRNLMQLILHCKTMCCHRKDLSSTSTTSGTRMNLIPQKQMYLFLEENASREEDKRYSSPQWYAGRRMWCGWKLHTIWRNQGSRRARILGHVFKRCNWKLAQEKTCNFIKHGYMLSFSTKHYLQLAMRKRYVSKLRNELYHKDRLTPRVTYQPNSQYEQQDPRSQDARPSWEPSSDSKSYGETCNNTGTQNTWSFLFLQPSTWIQHARTRSKCWSRNPRITNLKGHSFRTWASRRRSTTSAENRKIWLSTWTTPRPSNFTKILPNSNVLTAMPTGTSGIICCSCGRNMKSSRNPTEFDQNNRDVTSISGYVITKKRRRWAEHGPSEDVILFHVSTCQCSILFNNLGFFNKKGEFRKAEHIDQQTSPNERFNVTKDPPLLLLTKFWRNNYKQTQKSCFMIIT